MNSNIIRKTNSIPGQVDNSLFYLNYILEELSKEMFVHMKTETTDWH